MSIFMRAFLLTATVIFCQHPVSTVTDTTEVVSTVIQPQTIRNTNQMVQSADEPCPYTDEEIYLLALVTLAEAEGECEEGKRLVIDTILNRIDSSHFPDTVEEVIYQPHQFSSMWNGRYERVTVTDDICELVREEINNRQNSEVIFFTAGKYSRYGVPMFQVENHYFSSYE